MILLGSLSAPHIPPPRLRVSIARRLSLALHPCLRQLAHTAGDRICRTPPTEERASFPSTTPAPPQAPLTRTHVLCPLPRLATRQRTSQPSCAHARADATHAKHDTSQPCSLTRPHAPPGPRQRDRHPPTCRHPAAPPRPAAVQPERRVTSDPHAQTTPRNPSEPQRRRSLTTLQGPDGDERDGPWDARKTYARRVATGGIANMIHPCRSPLKERQRERPRAARAALPP